MGANSDLLFLVLSAMASGVKVNDDCVEKYNQLKLSKDIRFVIFKITDGNDEIVVEQTGAKDATYADFVGKLPADDSQAQAQDADRQLEGRLPQEARRHRCGDPGHRQVGGRPRGRAGEGAALSSVRGGFPL